MPGYEMQFHVCQQCKFVINGENSPVTTTALQNPENAKCNYKRQNLESLQGKWNGDLPKDIAKDAKGQDLSKNTVYTVGQINIDLGTLPSLMPRMSQNLCVLSVYKTTGTEVLRVGMYGYVVNTGSVITPVSWKQ